MTEEHKVKSNTFTFTWRFAKDQDDHDVVSIDVFKYGEWVAHYTMDRFEILNLTNFLTGGVK